MTAEIVGRAPFAYTTPLSNERLAELAREDADAAKKVDLLRAERKDLNKAIRDAEGAREAVVSKIRQGEETTMVAARFELDGSTMRIYRESDDTLLEERPADEKELQGVFSFASQAEQTMTEQLTQILLSGEQHGEEFDPLMRQIINHLTQDEVEDTCQRLSEEQDDGLLHAARVYEQHVGGNRQAVLDAIDARLGELG